jgi:hypothetical protein
MGLALVVENFVEHKRWWWSQPHPLPVDDAEVVAAICDNGTLIARVIFSAH